MNQKRDEVVRFLDKDLLPQVQEAFKQYKSADKSVLQAELEKLVATIQNAGMNPDESPEGQGTASADCRFRCGCNGLGKRSLLAPIQLLPPLLQRRRLYLLAGTRKASMLSLTRARKSSYIGQTLTSITSRVARLFRTTRSRSPGTNECECIWWPHPPNKTTSKPRKGKNGDLFWLTIRFLRRTASFLFVSSTAPMKERKNKTT